MNRRTRTNIAGGLVLILLGAWFLALRLYPELGEWFSLRFAWPVWVIGAGGVIFLLGLVFGEPGMSVPAAIVAGVGGILYWQNATGNWSTWSYFWALIPGFAGIGTLVSGLLGDKPRLSLREGGRLILISATLFIIFFAIFGGFGLLRWWPVLLVVLGLWVIFGSLIRGHRI